MMKKEEEEKYTFQPILISKNNQITENVFVRLTKNLKGISKHII